MICVSVSWWTADRTSTREMFRLKYPLCPAGYLDSSTPFDGVILTETGVVRRPSAVGASHPTRHVGQLEPSHEKSPSLIVYAPAGRSKLKHCQAGDFRMSGWGISILVYEVLSLIYREVNPEFELTLARPER
jgi:hypothetical protein